MKKRIGYFFLGFLPFLLVNGIQICSELFAYSVDALSVGLFPSDSNSYLRFAELANDTDYDTLIFLVYALASIIIFGLWYYMRLGGEFRINPGRDIRPLLLLGIPILIPGLQCLTSFVTNGLAYIFPKWWEAYYELEESAGLNDSLSFFTLLYGVLIGPLAEELVFRGCTLRLFSRVTRHFWIANLLQAILFGVFHGNWIQGIYAFIMGLVLGFICEKCGTIYYSMFLHIVFNFWGLVISPLFDFLYDSAWIYFILGLTLIISLGAGVFLILTDLHRIREEKEL